MKKAIFKSLFFSFILTNLSFLVKKPVICDSGSLFVVSFAPDCVSEKVAYFLRGWPVEFFWSNKTGFVLIWYLVDILIYLCVGLFIFSIVIPIFNKFLLKK